MFNCSFKLRTKIEKEFQLFSPTFQLHGWSIALLVCWGFRQRFQVAYKLPSPRLKSRLLSFRDNRTLRKQFAASFTRQTFIWRNPIHPSLYAILAICTSVGQPHFLFGLVVYKQYWCMHEYWQQFKLPKTSELPACCIALKIFSRFSFIMQAFHGSAYFSPVFFRGCCIRLKESHTNYFLTGGCALVPIWTFHVAPALDCPPEFDCLWSSLTHFQHLYLFI